MAVLDWLICWYCSRPWRTLACSCSSSALKRNHMIGETNLCWNPHLIRSQDANWGSHRNIQLCSYLSASILDWVSLLILSSSPSAASVLWGSAVSPVTHPEEVVSVQGLNYLTLKSSSPRYLLLPPFLFKKCGKRRCCLAHRTTCTPLSHCDCFEAEDFFPLPSSEEWEETERDFLEETWVETQLVLYPNSSRVSDLSPHCTAKSCFKFKCSIEV